MYTYLYLINLILNRFAEIMEKDMEPTAESIPTSEENKVEISSNNKSVMEGAEDSNPNNTERDLILWRFMKEETLEGLRETQKIAEAAKEGQVILYQKLVSIETSK